MQKPAVHLRSAGGAEGDYAALAAVATAAWPAEPLSAGFLRRQEAHRAPERLLAHALAERRDGDRGAVGMATWGHLPSYFHPRRFYFDVRVLPGFRRRGVGDALYRHLLNDLLPRDPDYLVCPVCEDEEPGVEFATRRGYRPVERTARSEMDPAAFDPAPFAGLEERLAAAGIEIRTLGELMRSDPNWPRKLHALICDVQRDVPTVEEFRPLPFAEWFRSYDGNPDLLPDGQLVALDDGTYVGLTQLWASEATDRLLFTGLTGVRRSYRRRGIATALKVRANLYAAGLRAADGRPPRIRTSNEESNPMLDINLELGFEEQPAVVFYRRDFKES